MSRSTATITTCRPEADSAHTFLCTVAHHRHSLTICFQHIKWRVKALPAWPLVTLACPAALFSRSQGLIDVPSTMVEAECRGGPGEGSQMIPSPHVFEHAEAPHTRVGTLTCAQIRVTFAQEGGAQPSSSVLCKHPCLLPLCTSRSPSSNGHRCSKPSFCAP